MVQRHVKCPACQTMLVLPANRGEGDIVRCGQCGKRLRIKPLHTPTEEQIASWIKRHPELDDEVRLPEGINHSRLSAEDTGASISGNTSILPATTDRDYFRMIQLKSEGVLFEFSASLLRLEAFRCAMPRRCMHCGTGLHLQAHVIIYGGQLRSSVSLEQEHAQERLALSDEEVALLDGASLLERLPPVPNVPAPGNLPMPYWLCDMCSAAGDISGQIQVNSATGAGWCRLKIHSPRRAAEFMDAVSLAVPAEREELRKFIESRRENPWDTLSLVVQHRLEQWFQPAPGEAFVAFIPDRDRTRTEDGMAGLLVSTKRLIHHTHARHHEAAQDLPVEVTLGMGKSRGIDRLGVHCATFDVQMAVDKPGVDLLRRGLSAAKYKATWV